MQHHQYFCPVIALYNNSCSVVFDIGTALISIYIGCKLPERDDSYLSLICFSTFVVPQLLEFTS